MTPAGLPPPQDSDPRDGEDEHATATRSTDPKSAGQGKKQKEQRPQVVVDAATVEFVNSLIARGASLREDATPEEKATYLYKLNQRRKRLNKLQKDLDSGDLEEGNTRADERVQEQPAGKRKSRTQDMPPEVMGATRKDIALGFDSHEMTPVIREVPKTPQDVLL